MNKLRSTLGEGKVVAKKPVMGSEDFSEFGRTTDKIPICMFWLGAVGEDVFKASQNAGKPLPSLHSPFFAPDAKRAIETGVQATTAACLELLARR